MFALYYSNIKAFRHKLTDRENVAHHARGLTLHVAGNYFAVFDIYPSSPIEAMIFSITASAVGSHT